MIVGMFSRPAAISWPGVVLSQDARHTMPSSSAPSTATSMSLAIRSRLGRMYWPAAPALVIASLGAAVRTSNATPPAALMASVSGATISSRWLKQLARLDEELTIAILGFSRSSSVSPSAVHCARRIAHGVVPGVKFERSLRSGTLPRLIRQLPAGQEGTPSQTPSLSQQTPPPRPHCGPPRNPASQDGFRGAAAEEDALVLQSALQFGDVDAAARDARGQCHARGGARGLAHGEAGAGDASGGLRAVRHGRAPAGDVQVVHGGWHDDPERQLVEPPRFALPAELDRARHMRLHRPAVHADGVAEVRAAEYVVLGELIGADDAARFADADLRGDVDDVGVFEAGRAVLDEGERVERLLAAGQLTPGQLVHVRPVDRAAVLPAQLGE